MSENGFRTRADFVSYAKEQNRTFLEQNRGNVYVSYVRDEVPELQRLRAFYRGMTKDGQLNREGNPEKVRGKPNAVLVAFKQGGGISVGWSAANRGTVVNGQRVGADEFVKIIGLHKAIKMASGGAVPIGDTPNRILSALPDFTARATQEFEFQKRPRNRVESGTIPEVEMPV